MKKPALEILKNLREQLDALEASILCGGERKKPPTYSHLPCLWSAIERNYDFTKPLSRWLTCAQICEENEIKKTRSNCNRLGQSIPKTIPRRRSNGKNLLLMPPLLEKF